MLAATHLLGNVRLNVARMHLSSPSQVYAERGHGGRRPAAVSSLAGSTAMSTMHVLVTHSANLDNGLLAEVPTSWQHHSFNVIHLTPDARPRGGGGRILSLTGGGRLHSNNNVRCTVYHAAMSNMSATDHAPKIWARRQNNPVKRAANITVKNISVASQEHAASAALLFAHNECRTRRGDGMRRYLDPIPSRPRIRFLANSVEHPGREGHWHSDRAAVEWRDQRVGTEVSKPRSARLQLAPAVILAMVAKDRTARPRHATTGETSFDCMAIEQSAGRAQ